MRRGYCHTCNLGENPVLEEKRVPFEDSEILAIQSRDRVDGYYVVVPGVVIRYHRGTPGIVPVSEVETLKPKERSHVKKLLIEAGLKGDVRFW